MLIVRFMSTSGKFKTIEEFTCKDTRELLDRVKGRYAPLGFTNFAIVDEGDHDGGRVTAKTPGGRSGRNVAFFDYGWSDE